MSDSAATTGLPGFHVKRPEPREETPPGCPPEGPRIVHRGAGQRAEIAISFDDGPSRWTPDVAAAFEEHGCRATFFLRGGAVAEHPGVVAGLAASGHELGNHLWSHTRAAALSRTEIRDELQRTADAIEAAGAPRPRLVRPPYYGEPDAVAEAAVGTGVETIVLRSIGTSDWEAETAAEILGPILAHALPGDVVCLHDGVSSGRREGDTRQPTVDAVRQMLPALLERGLRPVTISELLR